MSTQNCREKLTFKVGQTHLALRSPMFGEKKTKKNMCFFFKLLKSLGVLREKWIIENRRKSCWSYVGPEGAKTAFTKHWWAPFQMRKMKNVFLTLTTFGLMRLLKITVFQIGDLQNMLYFPSASHISPMEIFTLAD